MDIQNFPDDVPVEDILITAASILQEVEATILPEKASSVDADGVDKLRVALQQVKDLLMISGPRARMANLALLQDVQGAVRKILLHIAIQPNPYSWAVSNFSPSNLASFDPIMSNNIKQALRDHFAKSGLTYDGWNN